MQHVLYKAQLFINFNNKDRHSLWYSDCIEGIIRGNILFCILNLKSFFVLEVVVYISLKERERERNDCMTLLQSLHPTSSYYWLIHLIRYPHPIPSFSHRLWIILWDMLVFEARGCTFVSYCVLPVLKDCLWFMESYTLFLIHLIKERFLLLLTRRSIILSPRVPQPTGLRVLGDNPRTGTYIAIGPLSDWGLDCG